MNHDDALEIASDSVSNEVFVDHFVLIKHNHEQQGAWQSIQFTNTNGVHPSGSTEPWSLRHSTTTRHPSTDPTVSACADPTCSAPTISSARRELPALQSQPMLAYQPCPFHWQPPNLGCGRCGFSRHGRGVRGCFQRAPYAPQMPRNPYHGHQYHFRNR